MRSRLLTVDLLGAELAKLPAASLEPFANLAATCGPHRNSAEMRPQNDVHPWALELPAVHEGLQTPHVPSPPCYAPSMLA